MVLGEDEIGDGFDLRLMGLIWFWFHMGLMG